MEIDIKPPDKPVWTFDCETDPFKRGRVPRPFAWGIYTGSAYYRFDTADEVAQFLHDKDVYCYAHNGGKFDAHFLYQHANRYEPLTIINGRLAKWRIGVCEIRDSFNILPVALEKYKKQEIDYSIFEREERDKPENRAKIDEYLRLDCVYLYEFISKFFELYGFHLTQAGAALATWERMAGRLAPRSNPDYYETWREFFYGGRVQCFHRGEFAAPFEVKDINSAYPRAMLEWHPIGTQPIKRPNLDRCVGGPGPAFLRVRCRSRGAFPWRLKGRLYFPSDNTLRTYAVTGWEYLAAVETDTIRDAEILEIWESDRFHSFADYITHFYELRKEAKAKGDRAMTEFGKLFMNGLYGKFGANPEQYENYMLAACGSELDEQGYSFAGLLGPHTLGAKPLAPNECRYYNILTSASITGWVRAYLWRAICASNTPLYCDTDSLAAVSVNAPEGKELGQWKNEADDYGRFTYAAIAGKKLYAFQGERGWKVASKGVRLNEREIIDIARGQSVTYSPMVPTFSLRSKKGPIFTDRTLRNTAQDIGIVPD